MDTLHTQELDAYLFSGYWVALAVTIVLVVGAAAFHYEMFRLLTRLHGTHRLRIFYLMLSLILVHMLEIGLFGVGYYLLHATGSGDVMIFAHPSGGDVMHVFEGTFFDHIYYSAVVYTTLGFGELVPLGPLRVLTGMEALIGLVLITWSASFMFLEMQKFWVERDV